MPLLWLGRGRLPALVKFFLALEGMGFRTWDRREMGFEIPDSRLQFFIEAARHRFGTRREMEIFDDDIGDPAARFRNLEKPAGRRRDQRRAERSDRRFAFFLGVRHEPAHRKVLEIRTCQAHDDAVWRVFHLAGRKFPPTRILDLDTVLIERAKQFVVSLSTGATALNERLMSYSALYVVAGFGVATEKPHLDRRRINPAWWVWKRQHHASLRVGCESVPRPEIERKRV